MLFKDDRLYRPDEVADKLAIGRSTVYKLIKDVADPLPAFRPTHTSALRIRGKDANEWLDRRRVSPENE